MDQRHVHEPFIFAALAIALTAGFGYGAIGVAALAFKLPLGVWWIALAQAHGHAQLFGWAGLFVIGVGLFFLPRLRGAKLARIELAPWALACLVVGIALRALGQPLQAIAPPGSLYAVLGRFGTLSSGVLELGGVALFIAMIIASFRRARPLSPDAPIKPVRPYLALALSSLVAATLFNAALSVNSALSASAIFPSSFDDALTHLMIYGFVIPLAIALAIRNLPLFMRLASPPKRSLFPLFLVYVVGLTLRVVGKLEQSFFLPISAIIESGALLVFSWQLDALLRYKTPWTATRILPPANYIETRPPTRTHYPDYGEFGRFELLIISAFAWLAFANLIAVVDGASVVLGNSTLFNPDIERHAITVGFITLLIFGMAVRMIPGFSGKPRIASPRLVLATFWLGNLAALFRVAPLFAPDLPGMNIAFGLSGALGWLAVACLAVNLWRTFHSQNRLINPTL